MVILDNDHLVGIKTTTKTTNTTYMPVEDTTAFKILPTIGLYNTRHVPTNNDEQLTALPTTAVHASELFVGDDPKVDLTFINQTESPLRIELDILPLDTWHEILIFILKGLVMGAVILTSVLGNLLVIVSVARYHKLRVITNYFVVSMALADMLVALMAMVFNASVQLTGTWIFGSLMCDLWNSMDVYFSTVSILHLCCISIDRYTAIVQPLDYPLRMTKRTVACMLAVAWISPLFISVVPIFLGWYTTQEQLELLALNPGLCNFRVNLIYAMISSSMSFWIPGIIMLVMYYRIYREADRQEMMVYRNCVGQKGLEPVVSRRNRMQQSTLPALKRKLLNTRSTVAALLLNKHLHINGMSKGSVKITDNTQLSKNGVSNNDDIQNSAIEPLQSSAPPRPIGPGGEILTSDDSTPSPTPGGTPRTRRAKTTSSKRRLLNVGVRKSSGEAKAVSPALEDVVTENLAKDEVDDPREIEKDKLEVPLATPHPKKKPSPLNKMKRERKAAKTLGIIVSAFLLCWLPFFTWYLIDTLCGENCQSPELLVTILFWIGYFNSTLNPIIYAYFNRDFRKAFRKTLNHYYKVFGCRFCTKLCQKCCRCGTFCASLRKTCCCCCDCPLCYALCPRFSRGDDTPSSDIPQRSGVSSDYVHIEMTTVEPNRETKA